MSKLMNGGIAAEAFYDYLSQLKPIYSELESTNLLDSSPFYDERLYRYPVIVDTLYESDTYTEVLPETRAYLMELMNVISSRDMTKLIAHHYARYMGDLAAGPMYDFISRNLGVPKERLSFYDFSNIGDPGAIYEYRKSYGQKLDDLIPSKDHDRFIEEVLNIFTLTADIIEQLGQRWINDRD